MTEQTKTTFEPIVLDRFEYKLPKDEFVVYVEPVGFKYKMKHTKKEFNSEEKVKEFIENTLKERKRYQQLLKTLSVPELNKLFSDVVLLGLSPKQIGEYEAIELFEYTLVGDSCGYVKTFKSLDELKDGVADEVGLNFHSYLSLHSNKEDGEEFIIKEKW